MSISRLPEATTAEQLGLKIDNGDFAAIKSAVQRLGFKDEESMLRFALAVLSKSATRTLTITDANGLKLTLNPSGELLAPVEAPIE